MLCGDRLNMMTGDSTIHYNIELYMFICTCIIQPSVTHICCRGNKQYGLSMSLFPIPFSLCTITTFT